MQLIASTGGVKTSVLYVIAGESNSGGATLGNAQLPPAELQPNPKIKIWHNINGGFVDLQIGVNNLLGHTGLSGTSHQTQSHGLERSLALDAIGSLYLIKAGQGGSRISQWPPTATEAYHSILAARYNAAKAAIPGRVKPVLIWWQGINDANDGNTANWRANTEAQFVRVRTLMGAKTPIFAMKIMPNTANKIQINGLLDDIARSDPFTYAIDVSAADNDLVLNDSNHWDNAGMRKCGQSLAVKLRQVMGTSSGI